jgi:signal transduction histidine kinase
MHDPPSSVESTGPDEHRLAELEDRVRELETELAASRDRLAWLYERSDAWLAAVSHDLRSPLTLVLGYAQANLRRLPAGPESERTRRDLEAISAGARRLDKMIGQIVDDARLDLGHLHLDLRPFEPGPLVREEVRRQRRLAVDHHFRTEVPGELPLARGDPRRVAQIVSTLLSNAIVFSPPGSSVVARARPAADRLVITVSDAGAGVAVDEMPHLFEPGFRPERLRDARREGLGLSLRNAQRIATLLEAELTAESAGIDQGTPFRLKLPVAPAV